jgi:Family of unknown function (DUF5906)
MVKMSDIEYVKSFCDRFVPIKVELDSATGRHTKIPLISKWTSITPDQSKRVESASEYKDWRHFMFVTGEGTGLFVIDLDRKNPGRADHKGKIDGIEFFEDWCGPVEAADTFTSKTIGGGYHKVYLYTPELDGKIKSGRLTPIALCDVLFNGRGFTFGEGYEIINRMFPRAPPKSVINFIVNNTQNNLLNMGTTGDINQQQNVQQQNNLRQSTIAGALGITSSAPLSERINDAIGTQGLTWRVNNLDNAYQLIPNTSECCVVPGHHHTNDCHSCMYVYKSSVVCNCFSHGKKILQGGESRSIRKVFFDISDNDKGVMVKIVHEICDVARAQNLVRENGCVLRRIGNTHAYEYVSQYKDFLRSTLIDNTALEERPRRFNDLMVYMGNIDSIGFPFVKRDKRYIGFANGLLDIVSGELVGDSVLEHGVIPRHYIDQHCDLDNIDTPLLDRVLRYQLQSDEVYTCMMALIGRLFYDVRQFDNFDVIPFVVGDSNTGKSTLVDIVCAMFSPNSVGVLDSSHEMVFGLQSKYNKELIVAPEINDRMAQQLASDLFKKMVCGELVNLPIKHSEATSVQWRVPMFMCGNRYMSYQDDRGSISKRLAIFRFDRHVVEMDDSLKQGIIDNELSRVVVKSLRAYRTLIKHAGSRGFWNACPDYFRDTRDEMNQSTDYIYMFLTLGPEDNVWSNKVMYFVKVKDQCMMLEEFKRKFMNYMRFRHPNVRYKWDHDLSAFKRLGYEIMYTKVCRSCLREARKDCCENYDHANRSTRRVIKHIRCVERDEDE